MIFKFPESYTFVFLKDGVCFFITTCTRPGQYHRPIQSWEKKQTILLFQEYKHLVS
jgi:hypothetical protein